MQFWVAFYIHPSASRASWEEVFTCHEQIWIMTLLNLKFQRWIISCWVDDLLNLKPLQVIYFMLVRWPIELKTFTGDLFHVGSRKVSVLTIRILMARAPRHISLVKGTPQDCMLRFWKGKGTKVFSLWWWAPYEEIVHFYCESISRAPRQWPGGMKAVAFVAFVKYQDWSVETVLWQPMLSTSFKASCFNKLINLDPNWSLMSLQLLHI